MTFEEEMKSALENFMLEVGELLSDMETGLLALEQDSSDQESVNSVFRAAHTVKGSAGLFGLDRWFVSPMSSRACSIEYATRRSRPPPP